MALEVGIVGLPNVGKSTIFNALTAAGALAANYPFATIEPNVGVVDVPDPRLKVIHSFISTDKIVPAALRVVDIAGIVKGASVEDSARVHVRYELDIGREASDAIPGGTATFTVGNYGTAEVEGSTYTYDPVPGGAGKLIVREHGRFKTGNLFASDPSSEIEHHGVIQVMNDLDLSGHALVVDDTTANPVTASAVVATNHSRILAKRLFTAPPRLRAPAETHNRPRAPS